MARSASGHRELFDVPPGRVRRQPRRGHPDGRPTIGDFARYFGKERFAGRLLYGGSYGDNAATTKTDPRGQYGLHIRVTWATRGQRRGGLSQQRVFPAHPDARACSACTTISTTLQLNEQARFYLKPSSDKTPISISCCCGHVTRAKPCRSTSKTETDRAHVLQSISQTTRRGPRGRLRILRLYPVDENNQAIRIISYSPLLNDVASYTTRKRADPAISIRTASARSWPFRGCRIDKSAASGPENK